MPKQLAVVILVATGLPALVAGLVAFASPRPVEAVPAFARQYDLQCNACHTRPPRLNRFGEQFHMMGFQMPSAARPGGIVSSVREDGAVKTLIDSLALRIEGGLFEYTESPRETETKFVPPDEITLFVTRPLLPELSIFVEIEGEPNTVAFGNGRYFTRAEFGLGKEAFFMLNFGRLLGLLGAPTMEMGGQTMVGQHGGFSMHGPMLMAGKVDPNTNFSYATNRQLIAPTELEVAHGAVERLPVVPYAFASKFFGLFKNRDEREPQLVTDQVMYNTPGAPGADFHAMFNDVILGQIGFLRENEGFNTYAAARFDLLDRGELTFNVSALVNWGFGVVRAPDLEDPTSPAANASTDCATASRPTSDGRNLTSTARSSGIGSTACPASCEGASTAPRLVSRFKPTISSTRRSCCRADSTSSGPAASRTRSATVPCCPCRRSSIPGRTSPSSSATA